MRKLILTGTYAQYRDWLVLHKANERAAVYIHRPEQLRGLDSSRCEIMYGDDFASNPVYGSAELQEFVSRQLALAS